MKNSEGITILKTRPLDCFIPCELVNHYGGVIIRFNDGKSLLAQIDTDIEAVKDNMVEYLGQCYILDDYYEISE